MSKRAVSAKRVGVSLARNRRSLKRPSETRPSGVHPEEHDYDVTDDCRCRAFDNDRISRSARLWISEFQSDVKPRSFLLSVSFAM